MLIPSKHLDLERSVMRAASEVLADLRRHRIVRYDAVVRLIKKRTGDDGDAVVAPTLSFLFLLGRLEYHAMNDTFEYRSG